MPSHLPSRPERGVPTVTSGGDLRAWLSTRKVVVATISHGLGNQMFQYAAGLGLARQRRALLALDISHYETERERDYLLGRLRVTERVVNPRRRGQLLHRLLLKGAADAPLYQEPHFHFDPLLETQAAPVRIRGWFQCERHFLHVAPELRAHFRLRAPLSPTARAMAERIAHSVLPVSLHVRRGDYLRPSDLHYALPLDYYRAAADLLRTRLGAEPTYFVFSDDPAFVAGAFDFLADRVVVSGDAKRPEEDLMLMSACRHHVIANSSFSWWGAWLNPRADKMVIGPRHWFLDEPTDTADVCPPSWHLL